MGIQIASISYLFFLIVAYYYTVGMYHNLFKHLSLWFPIARYSKQCHLKAVSVCYMQYVQSCNDTGISVQYIPGSRIAGSEGVHV